MTVCTCTQIKPRRPGQTLVGGESQTSTKMLAGVWTGIVTPRPRPRSEEDDVDEGWFSAPEEEWQLTEQDTDAASQALNRWRLTPPAVAALLASENSRADGKAEAEGPATNASRPVSKHAVRPSMRAYAGLLVTDTPPHKIVQVPFDGVVRSGVEA